MIGIIGAMDIELEVILKEVKNLEKNVDKIRTFYTGQINGKDVVIVLAGIGKVNAGITTALLIEKYPVTAIVNIGVAGGQKGVEHKDVVVSKEVLYHDFDVTNFGTYVHGQVPGHEALFEASDELVKHTEKILAQFNFNYKIGKIASGDQFVYSKDKIKEVNAIYEDIYAIEMEAAAIAHAASLYNIPFIIYRSISDVLDDENQTDDFSKFVEEAAKNASLVLYELIKVL